MTDKTKKYVVTELGITWKGVKKIIGMELVLTDRQAKSLAGKISLPTRAVKQSSNVAEAAAGAVAKAEQEAALATSALEVANKRIVELEAATKKPKTPKTPPGVK